MPLRLEIVTAERLLFEGDVDVVVAPAAEGEIAVLPHHAPVMTTLQAGELRYRANGQETLFAVHGGFMDIRGDQVVVLADAAERVEEIDEARAEEAMRRAQERLRTHGQDIDLERALVSLRRAQVRLTVSRHRRRQRPIGPGSAPE